MPTKLPIPEVTRLVSELWITAEQNALQSLALKHPDEDEEFITKFFYGEFREAVRMASQQGRVESAFETDLRNAFPGWLSDDLLGLARGIQATAIYHDRAFERYSGGDLGIVLVRPNVSLTSGPGPSVDPSYERGLLCQAKIRRRKTRSGRIRWGTFSASQKKLLPDRLEYLALLLYDYGDPARIHLSPFRWQLCMNHSFAEVEEWLRKDAFPATTGSEAIIFGLGNCQIGTDSKTIIHDHICGDLRDALIIKIGWPDDKPPEIAVESETHTSVRRRQQVQIYLG
jgi:hypothetical protein